MNDHSQDPHCPGRAGGDKALGEGLTVHWVDHHREPQCAPNPDYPDGIVVNLSPASDAPRCTADLPYPAPRCGLYVVRCSVCGVRVSITTAGRPDDPRSVILPCRIGGTA